MLCAISHSQMQGTASKGLGHSGFNHLGSIEKLMPRPHPKPIRSESPGWGETQALVFLMFPRWSHWPRTVVLNIKHISESAGGLVKTYPLGPTHRICDSVGLGCGLRICISNKLPDDNYAAIWRPHFENHCCKRPSASLTTEWNGHGLVAVRPILDVYYLWWLHSGCTADSGLLVSNLYKKVVK